MKKYRKKPVVIEAIQFLPDTKFPLGWGLTDYTVNADRSITINTIEGKMRADFGDWIIKGIMGEFYPCKHAIFEKSYEEVSMSLDLSKLTPDKET
jgi:hypothetical protein